MSNKYIGASIGNLFEKPICAPCAFMSRITQSNAISPLTLATTPGNSTPFRGSLRRPEEAGSRGTLGALVRIGHLGIRSPGPRVRKIRPAQRLPWSLAAEFNPIIGELD